MALAMESLRMTISLPPFSPPSFHSHRFRTRQCRSLRISGSRVHARRVLPRARRGDGDGNEDASGTGRSDRFVSPNLEVESGGNPRSLWRKVWELGGRKLGFGGEPWEEDARGQRELEELDLFLEGRGSEFHWKEVLQPSVENVLALVLTGLFAYAVALIGWQLLLVAAAITLSALKYAVIAAVLLGVLIFFI